MDRRRKWQIFSTAASVAAVALIRYGFRRAWSEKQDASPPADPAADDASWPKAVAWSLSVATAGGLARLVARHGAAAAWRKVTGKDVPA